MRNCSELMPFHKNPEEITAVWRHTATQTLAVLTNNDVLKDVGVVVRCSCHCGTEIQTKRKQNISELLLI